LRPGLGANQPARLIYGSDINDRPSERFHWLTRVRLGQAHVGSELNLLFLHCPRSKTVELGATNRVHLETSSIFIVAACAGLGAD
jgi:hypothetical protein